MKTWKNAWQEFKGSVYHNFDFPLKRIFVYIEENQKIIAGISATEHSIKTIFGEKKILQAHGNPFFKNSSSLNSLLEKFKEESKKYFYATVMPSPLNTLEKEFIEAGFNKTINHTILISLLKNEEELFQALEKKSSRWGVKQAEKNNLKFSLATENEVNSFYNLYKSTADLGKFKSESEDFLISLRDTDFSKLFLIKQADKIIAGGLILIDSSGYSILDLTGASEEGLKLQAMPFLYWNLIKYSKSLGLKYFDLGGYDSEAKEGDKTYNINKFKERFGGAVMEQPVYSTNWKYPFFRNLMKHLRFIKKIYKKQ